jgi:hypothetical protein
LTFEKKKGLKIMAVKVIATIERGQPSLNDASIE